MEYMDNLQTFRWRLPLISVDSLTKFSFNPVFFFVSFFCSGIHSQQVRVLHLPCFFGTRIEWSVSGSNRGNFPLIPFGSFDFTWCVTEISCYWTNHVTCKWFRRVRIFHELVILNYPKHISHIPLFSGFYLGFTDMFIDL